jgi:ankyrin repeat protein
MVVSRTSASSSSLYPATDTVPACLKNLTGAIDKGQERGLRYLLTGNAAQIQSENTLHGLLEHAYPDSGKPCPLSIKMLLADQPKTNLQRALHLAAENYDPFFAEYLVQNGANPHIADLQDKWMRAVLQFPRRKAILYPGAAQPNETELDQALREGRMVDAHQLLDIQENVLDVWRDAVRDNKVDIQRALLLLGYVDSEVRYRLGEVGFSDIQDPGVKAVMKEIPYYSPKRGEPKDFNHKVPGIECRHLALHHLKGKASDASAKSNFDPFQNLKEIKDRVFAGNEEYTRLKAHAGESYLIDNGKFGPFLVQQFEAMERKGESTKLMMMESTTHVMGLSLLIKEKEDGTKVFVVQIYDPNRTTTQARSASDDLQAFAVQDLRAYIDGDTLQKIYFPERKGISVLHVYPGNAKFEAMASLPPGAAADRKLKGCIPDDEIDATAVWHLMSDGFAADLRRLKDVIAGRPDAERMTLLSGKSHAGYPALWMALQNGHADAIKAFGELLKLIPIEQRAELIAAKDAAGTPGFLMALQDGRTDAVEAYGELLKLIPIEQRAELIAAKDAVGTPGFLLALENGHADTVKAYGKLIRSLDIPKEQYVELLAAKDAVETPALFVALENGHADAVKAYGEVIRSLDIPKDHCVALLAAKDIEDIPGVLLASDYGHIDAVKALFGELLQLIPVKLRVEMLAVKRAEGTSESSLDLQSPHTAAVKALFEELLQSIPADQQDQLLLELERDCVAVAAQNGDAEALKKLIANGAAVHATFDRGVTTLMRAAENGHVAAVKVLIDNGAEINADINATDDRGLTALMRAAQNGHFVVVQVLIAKGADIHATDKQGVNALMLAAYSRHTLAQKLLIRAKDKNDGTTALMFASSFGHTDTVHVLIKHKANIEEVDDNGNTALLLAAQKGHTDTVHALIKHGANIKAENKDGNTARMLAEQNRYPNIVQMLENLRTAG